MKTVGKILTAFFFIFGVLFTLAAFSRNQANQGGTLVTGIILLIICAVLGFFSFRKAAVLALRMIRISHIISTYQQM